MFIFFKQNISEDTIKENRIVAEKFNFIDFDFGIDKKGIYLFEDVKEEYVYENFFEVEKVVHIQSSYKFVSRDFKKEDTIVNVGNLKIGSEHFQVIGGPCSFENEDMFREIAVTLKKFGVNIVRGGAFKPRTSPYFFQGIGERALKIMKRIGDEVGVKIVSEIVSVEHIDLFNEYVDIIQVGARNMQNYELLKKLGKIDKPVLLKRGLSSTFEEFLLSAEYIVSNGNINVILCERGIRTFEKLTRNTLDISVVPFVKKFSHLPIIVDPSHASGRYDFVEPLALSGVAAGCDGIIVEVHNNPEIAFSDGHQSINFINFKNMNQKIRKIREVLF